MARYEEADITIFDDIEVTIGYRVAPAERDVGIMSDYVDEWFITHVFGRKCVKEPKTLYAKIAATPGAEERICERLLEQ